MKVLVTGGAGFIGSHVVDSLIKGGHEVVIVDNLSTGSRRNLNPKAVFYEMDIRDPQLRTVVATEKPDVINHHAAQATVLASLGSPVLDAQVNIVGSLNLLECARDFGVTKFIYISTGGALYGEPEYLPCDENHPIRPISPYGVSKHTVEHYLYLFKENYGLDYAILRYPNVYGPRQDPAGEAGVVAIFSHQMLNGERPVIYGSGEQERDFVYVEDVVRANLLVMASGDGGTYNLGSGRGTSVNELFAMMKDITEYGQDPIYEPPRTGEVFKIYLDATKANIELGWRATVSLQEGLERTVEFFASESRLKLAL